MDVDFERIRLLHQACQGRTTVDPTQAARDGHEYLGHLQDEISKKGTTGHSFLDYILCEPLFRETRTGPFNLPLSLKCIDESKKMQDLLQENRGKYLLFEETLSFFCDECIGRKPGHHKQYSLGRIASDGPIVLKVPAPGSEPPFRIAINTQGLYVSYAPHGTFFGNDQPTAVHRDMPFVLDRYVILDPAIHSDLFPVFKTLKPYLDAQLRKR